MDVPPSSWYVELLRQKEHGSWKAVSRILGTSRSLAQCFAVALLLAAGCTGQTPTEPELDSHEASVPVDGAVLHVTITGPEHPDEVLVAVHGGPGNASDYMASMHRLANEKLAVVTYDQRGVGDSVATEARYTMDEYLSDLDAVRRFVGQECIHLLGHSWGGLIAQRYAVQYSANVKSIIFVGSGIFSAAAHEEGRQARDERIARLQQEGIIPDPITKLDDILPAYFSDPLFDCPAEMSDMFYDPTVEQLTWIAIDNYDFSAGIDVISVPVLVIYGEDDPYGLPLAESTVNALPDDIVETAALEDCGHYWQEQEEDFLSVARAFLNRVSD